MHILLAVLIVILFAILTPFPTSANEPVLINSFGIWTMKDLGYSDVAVPVEQERETASVHYRLPDDASQGPEKWYLVHLHFIIEVSQQSEGGLAVVSAGTNGYSAALIEFKLIKTLNSRTITWGTTDLLYGSRSTATTSSRVEAYYTNYLRTAGVQPENNTLTFQLEQYRGAKVTSLTVLEDSAIIYTPVPLPKLKMDVRIPRKLVTTGDEFTIGVSLRNQGWPIKDVVAQARYTEDAFRDVSANPQRFPSISGEVEAAFTFEALKLGRHIIEIEAGGKTGGRLSATIEVLVGTNNSGGISVWWAIVAAFLAVVVLFGLWLVRRYVLRFTRR